MSAKEFHELFGQSVYQVWLSVAMQQYASPDIPTVQEACDNATAFTVDLMSYDKNKLVSTIKEDL